MMQSIRRSGQLALRNPRFVCPYANGSRRAFSLSYARFRGALPSFLPPSSPELSETLALFNSKVLLPLHLTKEQQDLVYSQESRAKLESEPIEITLGDVTLPLEHLDKNRLPDRRDTLVKIMSQSKTPEDWENVLRCVEGFVEAGWQLTPRTKESIIRKMNNAGMHHIILKGLQRVKESGLSLRYWVVTRQVLRGLHDKAAKSGWDKDETAKAMKMAKQVVELMESSEHHGHIDVKSSSDKEETSRASERKEPSKPSTGDERPSGWNGMDYRSDPEVIALPTELAAVMAERHGGDVEEVKTMCGRLVAAMEQGKYMETLDNLSAASQREPKFKKATDQAAEVGKFIYRLLSQIMIWNALKTSRSVLGSDMPKADIAFGYEQSAEAVITEAIANLDQMMMRDGKKMNFAMEGYIRSALEQCK
ncbi:hypothetical protein GMOD_00004453 [Pyrenophora seminiperda CCB06]|uniref:Uncharacterized protein n=1 Tax=Pyrenophora seminiperda CCB06 TaxID=1302712 RepID=A0A3M7M1G4_9PLEO|nr:hypothetical protein GMOD_00004453 [Pyrenophora seminiperda CCB06]